MEELETVIGLEIHVQLMTQTKLWSSCPVSVSAFENGAVCEVSSGHPGTLPHINKKAIELAVKSAIVLGCKINKDFYFERKNYFYPDLPKGYQITQLQGPIAQEGFVDLGEKFSSKKIGIERIQIEEDTGKSVHKDDYSLINLNRSSTALIEIVTRPHISSSKEASAFYKKIHKLLTQIGSTQGDMQHGNLRCDVNISLRKKGEKSLGTRTEIKNINSFKFVEKAILLEESRQKKLLLKGEPIKQVTMLFDLKSSTNKVMREKSNADDYRYFPEPDIPKITLSQDMIDFWKKDIPELSDSKIARFISQYSLSEYDADILSKSEDLGLYFEKAVSSFKGRPKKLANFICSELVALIKKSGVTIGNSPVSADQISELLNSVENGQISGKMAKNILVNMYDNRISVAQAIAKEGKLLNSEDEISRVIDEVLNNNIEQREEFKKGKTKLFGFFVGEVMKQTKGKAVPELVNKILKKKLST